MYNQDFLLRTIDDFFSTIRKLVKLDIDEEREDFEKQVNDLFNSHFDLEICNVNELLNNKNFNQYFNHYDKQILVLLFLKISKLYFKIDNDLSFKYLALAKKTLESKNSFYFYESEYLSKTIKNYLNYLES
ncbi:hypothetical protein [Flavobacterium sp.]|uniref:hypothetical protein n=1 Tax=Flavobacterium sp. TaxID=239 RepID=UPI004047DDD5